MPYAWQTPGSGEALVRREVAPLEAGRDELVQEEAGRPPEGDAPS
ncbi:MAG: hypothetical protein ACKOFN_02245 [Vulcanococcus sp.]